MFQPMLKGALLRQNHEIAKARTEERGLESGPLTAERLVSYLDGLNPSTSGVRINQSTAMQLSAVWACVRIIAETLASLPLVVYERKERGKQRAPSHALYELLHDRPNDEMTAMQLRELLQSHLLLWGNAYAEIEINGAGRVMGLWPLMPDKMQVRRIDGVRVYHYTLPNGETKPLPADRVFHIPGLGYDGLKGYSPIDMARNSLGLTKATEDFGAHFFEKGAVSSMVYSHPKTLSTSASDNLRRSLEAGHAGLSRQHRIMIVEEGMTATATSIPNNHAQFLETRKFQTTEVARWFRVPPHMLADLDRATFSNIEQQGQEFVSHTIRPWAVRWEQAISMDLFGDRERKTFFAEHVLDGLLRGDSAARGTYYSTLRNIGVLSANDIRELENMNPVEGGDEYLVQGAMVPVDQAGKAQEPAKEEPAPDIQPAEDDDARAGYRELFRSVADRMVKRELAMLRKGLKQGEAGWSQAVEGVYREHSETLAEAFEPVISGLLLLGPKESRALTRTANALAEELAGKELTESRKDLDTAGFAGAEQLFTAWESQRAERSADRCAEFIAGLLHTTKQLRVA